MDIPVIIIVIKGSLLAFLRWQCPKLAHGELQLQRMSIAIKNRDNQLIEAQSTQQETLVHIMIHS